jgi:3D (Asp-Asp-Asp) domain-containing protein
VQLSTHRPVRAPWTLIAIGIPFLAAIVGAAGCAESVRSRPPAEPPSPPSPPPPSLALPSDARPISVVATAYCRGTRTAAGTRVAKGIVAADPALLPIGTVIRVSGLAAYDGVYTVKDTGPKVKGRRVDLYVANCAEAVRFGRRPARVSIVQRGSKQATRRRAA